MYVGPMFNKVNIKGNKKEKVAGVINQNIDVESVQFIVSTFSINIKTTPSHVSQGSELMKHVSAMHCMTFHSCVC